MSHRMIPLACLAFAGLAASMGCKTAGNGSALRADEGAPVAAETPIQGPAPSADYPRADITAAESLSSPESFQAAPQEGGATSYDIAGQTIEWIAASGGTYTSVQAPHRVNWPGNYIRIVVPASCSGGKKILINQVAVWGGQFGTQVQVQAQGGKFNAVQGVLEWDYSILGTPITHFGYSMTLPTVLQPYSTVAQPCKSWVYNLWSL